MNHMKLFLKCTAVIMTLCFVLPYQAVKCQAEASYANVYYLNNDGSFDQSYANIADGTKIVPAYNSSNTDSNFIGFRLINSGLDTGLTPTELSAEWAAKAAKGIKVSEGGRNGSYFFAPFYKSPIKGEVFSPTNVSISSSDSGVLVAGDTIDYTITADNTANTNNLKVIFDSAVPDNTTFVKGDNGVTVTNHILSWPQMDLPAKSKKSVTFTVKIGATVQSTNISDIATVVLSKEKTWTSFKITNKIAKFKILVGGC